MGPRTRTHRVGESSQRIRAPFHRRIRRTIGARSVRRGGPLESERRADTEKRRHVIHLRAGHEEHVRCEGEEKRCEQRNAGSIDLDAPAQTREARDGERATQRHDQPDSAHYDSERENGGPARRKLREDDPVPFDQKQGAEELWDASSTRDSAAGELPCLEELSDFVHEQADAR